MSESALDQVVKGAPSSGRKSTSGVPLLVAQKSGKNAAETGAHRMTIDPLSSLPSSPSQIYLNLLILEASLRAQYLALRARRRQHLFVLVLLGAWIIYFGYALFLRPREDGKGIGGSPYWVVDMAEKVALMGGVVTGVLIWGTGQWERGFRWPRRWISVANRGLRVMNCKIVILKGPWWTELLSYSEYLFPFNCFFTNGTINYQHVKSSMDRRSFKPVSCSVKQTSSGAAMVEEDVAPGGNCIRLLLLPKYFSPTFRENWELYRSEYWDRENERRSHLRKEIRQQNRDRANGEASWVKWTKWGNWSQQRAKRRENRQPYDYGLIHGHNGPSRERGKLRVTSTASKNYDRSWSRSSSRNSTPSHEDYYSLPDDLGGVRPRRGSSSVIASTNERSRKKAGQSSGSLKLSRLTPTGESRSATPGSSSNSPSLSKRDSFISVASTESGFEDKESNLIASDNAQLTR